MEVKINKEIRNYTEKMCIRDSHSGSAKTLKSIKITHAARLEKFNLESLAGLTATDELDLPSLGEKKVALFALIPDNVKNCRSQELCPYLPHRGRTHRAQHM